MKETSKATERRLQEGPLWPQVFRGKVLDVGPGDDPLNPNHWPAIEELTLFDKEQGDANHLLQYFERETFDCVHSSQCLEHLRDPIDALRQMLEITKPGGYVVATVPDFDLYEHRVWPSIFNGDHKSTWSLWRLVNGLTPRSGMKKPIHVHVPDLRVHLYPHIVSATLCCDNYDWMDTVSDQTLDYAKRVEAFIEIVIRKNERVGGWE